MKPYPHQEELSNEALKIIRENGYVYLAMEERTGKTLTAILTAEKSAAQVVLVITKKKALDGWKETLAAYNPNTRFVVVNYHQAYKYCLAKFDLVILDESHNYISSYPKPGKIWKELKELIYGLPIIYSSATPYAQGPQMLYHQFALCAWGPWVRYSNFYKWFNEYGKPYTKEINGINVPQYDRAKQEEILADVQHVFITRTRQELGFEFEPEDKLHYVELAKNTKLVYNTLVKDELIELSVGLLVCDNPSKLRTALHQLEGGTIKIDNDRHVLANTEKVDYILKHFGDTEDVVIMYNFKAEPHQAATLL